MHRFLSAAFGCSIGVLTLNWSAPCQTVPLQHDPTFEVASVRPTAPGPSFTVMEGGGQNGRIRYTSMSLRNLVVSAYDVRYDSIVGPAWLKDVWLDIAATFPPGTSKEQFRLMLLHLLEERLGLVAHLESRQTDGYALVVAKSGPRLEPAAAEAAAADQSPLPELSPPASIERDEDGFPIMPAGPGVQERCIPGGCRFRATSASMEELADHLPCSCKIVDETHLRGKYKFVLTADLQSWVRLRRLESSNPDPSAEAARAQELAALGAQSFPDLPHALEKQLGLKLERKKVPAPVVYVDHIERTPTEN